MPLQHYLILIHHAYIIQKELILHSKKKSDLFYLMIHSIHYLFPWRMEQKLFIQAQKQSINLREQIKEILILQRHFLTLIFQKIKLEKEIK